MTTKFAILTTVAAIGICTGARASDGGTVVVESGVAPAVLNADDRFGTAVAVDGTWLAVGAIEVDMASPGTGRVNVFERQGSAWIEFATLVPSIAGPGERYGSLVALDGATLAVAGATGVLGAVVYTFDGTSWTEEAVVAEAVPGDVNPVSMDLCGSTLVIGNGSSTSDVVVFERVGSDWTQTQQTLLQPSDGGLGFGAAVGIDGDTLAVGAPSAKVQGLQQAGQAYVFERIAGNWTEVAVLNPLVPSVLQRFGTAIDVSGDLVAIGRVGSPQEIELYRRSGAIWALDDTIPILGIGMHIVLEGQRLLYSNLGTRRLYTLGPSGWDLRYDAPEILGAFLGFDIDLDLDQWVIGGPSANTAGLDAGLIEYYRQVPPTPIAYCTAKTTTEGCVPAVGWNGGASLTGTDDFAVLARDVPPGKTGLFFWGTSGQAAVPFLGGTLCVAPSLTRGPVSISIGNAPCDAGFVLPFTQALMSQEGFDVCETVHGQWWMRDPQNPDGTGVALTDGIEFTIDF